MLESINNLFFSPFLLVLNINHYKKYNLHYALLCKVVYELVVAVSSFSSRLTVFYDYV